MACEKCQRNCKALIERVPNDIVIINSEDILTEIDFITKKEKIQNVQISTITKSFVWANRKFLKGIIEHISSSKHYVIHVNRNGMWKRYDDLEYLSKPKRTTHVMPAILFYDRDYEYEGRKMAPIPANIPNAVIKIGIKLVTFLA